MRIAASYKIIKGKIQLFDKDGKALSGKGKLKKQYTLKEILAETSGAYGSSRFAEVVTGSAG